MQMTSSIVYWKLSQHFALDPRMRSTNVMIETALLYRSDRELRSHALYLVDCARPIVSVPSARDDIAFLFFDVGDSGLPFTPAEGDYAVMREPIERETILEAVFNVWADIMRWDARLSEAVAAGSPSKEVFDIGYEMLPRPFGIHDMSLKMVYQTPGFIEDLGMKEESAEYQRIIRSHTVNMRFHRSMQHTKPFIYYDEQTDSELLCVNIRYEGRFVGRIVAPLSAEEKQIDAGQTQLFAIYADHIEDAYRQGSDAFLPQRRNQAMHDLFRDMANGLPTTAEVVSKVLSGFGWDLHHGYEVIVFKLHNEPGWVARTDVSRAYLCRLLEWEWPQSSAVEHGEDIAWVINLDLAGVGSDDYGLFQSLAAFVRDTVCNAGVSRRFDDFTLLDQATHQADAALAIGMIRHPHFWYYPFDDYKLEYLQSKMVEDMAATQLCHPAILTLRAHDAEKETELSKTLECYLSCEQNAATASERMFIHRSTFFRRLEHIRELTSIDLDDPEEVLYLRLSYWLLSKE